jgi:hypothetical protein
MKPGIIFAFLLLSACGKAAVDRSADSSSEAEVSARAAEISAAADAEINKSIADIEEADLSVNAAGEVQTSR